MIADRLTLDTNILVYAFDVNDKKRQVRAIEIIEDAAKKDCVLTLQSLAEFYHVTTRKQYLPKQVARDQIEDWQTIFPVATSKTGTLLRAMEFVHKNKLSFWDAMLLSCARDAGVRVLYSEDFNHSQEVGGVKILNPF